MRTSTDGYSPDHGADSRDVGGDQRAAPSSRRRRPPGAADRRGRAGPHHRAGLRRRERGVPGRGGNVHAGGDERQDRARGRGAVPGRGTEAIEIDQGLAATIGDPLTEATWRAFSRASAAAGVHSTLKFPAMHAGHAIGSVNLYGGSEDAFTGRHEDLAEVFGPWAPGAVVNADLSFSTRRLAEQAPLYLRDQARVDVASGILAAIQDIDVESAFDRLKGAATRAGVPMTRVADIVIMLNSD